MILRVFSCLLVLCLAGCGSGGDQPKGQELASEDCGPYVGRYTGDGGNYGGLIGQVDAQGHVTLSGYSASGKLTLSGTISESGAVTLSGTLGDSQFLAVGSWGNTPGYGRMAGTWQAERDRVGEWSIARQGAPPASGTFSGSYGGRDYGTVTAVVTDAGVASAQLHSNMVGVDFSVDGYVSADGVIVGAGNVQHTQCLFVGTFTAATSEYGGFWYSGNYPQTPSLTAPGSWGVRPD